MYYLYVLLKILKLSKWLPEPREFNPKSLQPLKARKMAHCRGVISLIFFLGSAKYIFLEILHDNTYITIHNKIHRSNYKCIHKVENFFMTETGIGVWWLWTLWF